MKKLLSISLAAVLTVAVLTGCKPTTDEQDSGTDQAGNPTPELQSQAPSPQLNGAIPSIQLTDIEPDGKMVEVSEENIGFDMQANLSYTEELGLSLYHGDLGSLYLIQIVRPLESGEKKSIKGYDELNPSVQEGKFYEAVILYDYLRDVEMKETIYFKSGDEDAQLKGRPPYAAGESMVLFMVNYGNNTYQYVCSFFTLPENAKEVGEDSVVLNRHILFNGTKDFSLPLEESERTYVTTCKENPVINKQKFPLGELVRYIRNDLEERGYDPDNPEKTAHQNYSDINTYGLKES